MKAAKPADRKRMLIHLTLGADEKELVEGEEGEEGEEGDDGEEDNEGGVSRASVRKRGRGVSRATEDPRRRLKDGEDDGEKGEQESDENSRV